MDAIPREGILINLILYTILILIFIYICHFLYYKIKHPFWSILPAFHKRKLWYWFLDEQIINYSNLSRESKYYNYTYKTTHIPLINEENTDVINNVVSFINMYFLNYSDAMFSISNTQIDNITRTGTYLTITECDKDIHGCIVSYPVLFWCKNMKYNELYVPLNKKYKNYDDYKKKDIQHKCNDTFMHSNYVDYLCIHEKYRNHNKAAILIYTHITNILDSVNKNALNKIQTDYVLPLFLFKNEGILNTSLVPIIKYNGYVIDLDNITLNNCLVNLDVLKKESSECILLNGSTAHIINSFIDIIFNTRLMDDCGFNIIFMFTKEMLLKQLNTNEIIVYCITTNGICSGYYIFKNIHSLIDNTSFEFECIASIDTSYKNNKGTISNSFIFGFKIACVLCKTMLNNLYIKTLPDEKNINTKEASYKLCCIEETSHNYHIIHMSNIYKRHKYNIPLAYYSYNGLIHTKKPQNVFIIS
jgi:hypothetical protein